MSDGDVQALVVDNGSGMCKVRSRTISTAAEQTDGPLPSAQSASRTAILSTPSPFERQSPFECPGCPGCHLAVQCDATPACCTAPPRCDTIPPRSSRSSSVRPSGESRSLVPVIRSYAFFSLNCAPPPLFSLSRPVSLEMMLPAPCSRRLSAARATKSVPTRGAHTRHAQDEPNTRHGEPNTASHS